MTCLKPSSDKSGLEEGMQAGPLAPGTGTLSFTSEEMAEPRLGALGAAGLLSPLLLLLFFALLSFTFRAPILPVACSLFF